VGDPFVFIIDYHSELIGGKPIRSVDDKVTNLPGEILFKEAQKAIRHHRGGIRHMKPYGSTGTSWWQPFATGPGIDHCRVLCLTMCLHVAP
jgi:hypothetical protein